MKVAYYFIEYYEERLNGVYLRDVSLPEYRTMPRSNFHVYTYVRGTGQYKPSVLRNVQGKLYPWSK